MLKTALVFISYFISIYCSKYYKSLFFQQHEQIEIPLHELYGNLNQPFHLETVNAVSEIFLPKEDTRIQINVIFENITDNLMPNLIQHDQFGVAVIYQLLQYSNDANYLNIIQPYKKWESETIRFQQECNLMTTAYEAGSYFLGCFMECVVDLNQNISLTTYLITGSGQKQFQFNSTQCLKPKHLLSFRNQLIFSEFLITIFDTNIYHLIEVIREESDQSISLLELGIFTFENIPGRVFNNMSKIEQFGNHFIGFTSNQMIQFDFYNLQAFLYPLNLHQQEIVSLGGYEYSDETLLTVYLKYTLPNSLVTLSYFRCKWPNDMDHITGINRETIISNSIIPGSIIQISQTAMNIGFLVEELVQSQKIVKLKFIFKSVYDQFQPKDLQYIYEIQLSKANVSRMQLNFLPSNVPILTEINEKQEMWVHRYQLFPPKIVVSLNSTHQNQSSKLSSIQVTNQDSIVEYKKTYNFTINLVTKSKPPSLTFSQFYQKFVSMNSQFAYNFFQEEDTINGEEIIVANTDDIFYCEGLSLTQLDLENLNQTDFQSIDGVFQATTIYENGTIFSESPPFKQVYWSSVNSIELFTLTQYRDRSFDLDICIENSSKDTYPKQLLCSKRIIPLKLSYLATSMQISPLIQILALVNQFNNEVSIYNFSGELVEVIDLQRENLQVREIQFLGAFLFILKSNLEIFVYQISRFCSEFQTYHLIVKIFMIFDSNAFLSNPQILWNPQRILSVDHDDTHFIIENNANLLFYEIKQDNRFLLQRILIQSPLFDDDQNRLKYRNYHRGEGVLIEVEKSLNQNLITILIFQLNLFGPVTLLYSLLLKTATNSPLFTKYTEKNGFLFIQEQDLTDPDTLVFYSYKIKSSFRTPHLYTTHKLKSISKSTTDENQAIYIKFHAASLFMGDYLIISKDQKESTFFYFGSQSKISIAKKLTNLDTYYQSFKLGFKFECQDKTVVLNFNSRTFNLKQQINLFNPHSNQTLMIKRNEINKISTKNIIKSGIVRGFQLTDSNLTLIPQILHLQQVPIVLNNTNVKAVYTRQKSNTTAVLWSNGEISVLMKQEKINKSDKGEKSEPIIDEYISQTFKIPDSVSYPTANCNYQNFAYRKLTNYDFQFFIFCRHTNESNILSQITVSENRQFLVENYKINLIIEQTIIQLALKRNSVFLLSKEQLVSISILDKDNQLRMRNLQQEALLSTSQTGSGEFKFNSFSMESFGNNATIIFILRDNGHLEIGLMSDLDLVFVSSQTIDLDRQLQKRNLIGNFIKTYTNIQVLWNNKNRKEDEVSLYVSTDRFASFYFKVKVVISSSVLFSAEFSLVHQIIYCLSPQLIHSHFFEIFSDSQGTYVIMINTDKIQYQNVISVVRVNDQVENEVLFVQNSFPFTFRIIPRALLFRRVNSSFIDLAFVNDFDPLNIHYQVLSFQDNDNLTINLYSKRWKNIKTQLIPIAPSYKDQTLQAVSLDLEFELQNQQSKSEDDETVIIVVSILGFIISLVVTFFIIRKARSLKRVRKQKLKEENIQNPAENYVDLVELNNDLTNTQL